MLPIGTIVYLKEGSGKIMILNRAPILPVEDTEESMWFDYSGCLYPQGLDPNNVFYFNQENIDRVIFEGYSDEDEERFHELFQEWIRSNKDKVKKGNVTKPLE